MPKKPEGLQDKRGSCSLRPAYLPLENLPKLRSRNSSELDFY